MKKVFVLSFLILPFAVNAQFSKGNIFLGGTLTTIFQNSDLKPPASTLTQQTNNSFGISPSIGFFLNEKIAIGAAIGYTNGLQKYDYTQVFGYSTKVETYSIGINPYVRFYQPITSSIYFALQGGLGVARSNSKQTNTGTVQNVTETPAYSLTATFRPIFIFFPSPRWGVEASIGSLGYSYNRNLPDAGSTTSFGLNAGSFSFGIAYYFIKK